ncbi:A24 family peptidase [Granulicella sibirica]|uniref:Type IV prepilin peptidase TadV/CpaA n=1 Tax=Granulicella sibirica TaxID=2479048 RepID=A0A4Q0T8F8_9BACT|nr:prepilin peptidase [Granulicella sibirica]RXH58006.1 Type IV prepilin peptidase TadV/CpaA [Granulicella sibirica]
MTTYDVTHNLAAMLALGCGLIGALTDVRTRRIPNWLTGPAMLAGLLLHFVAGGWRECGSSFLALLACGAVFFVFHLAGGMGAGDVKLIAAEGCFLGLASVGPLLVWTALCGGLMGVILAVKRGAVRQTLSNVLVLTAHHGRSGLTPHPEINVLEGNTLRLPYALAIASGAILTIVLQSSVSLPR